MRSIKEAKTQQDGSIRLTFSDGLVGEIDLRPLIQKGGVFAALNDDKIFCQVRIGEGGRYLEWPGGIELCADSLWHEVREQVDLRPDMLTEEGEPGDDEMRRHSPKDFMESWQSHGVIGAWKDRKDIGDTIEYARRLREKSQKRDRS